MVGFRTILSSKNLVANQTFNPFEETENYEKGFTAHYNEYLIPLIERYEIQRVFALKDARKKIIIYVPVAIFVPFLCLFSWFSCGVSELVAEILIYVNIALIGFTVTYIKKSITLYQTSIKTKVFPKILNFLGNFIYDEEHDSFNNDLENYEIFDILPSYSFAECEDRISGIYKTVNIVIFEANLKRRQKNGSYSVFSGLLIKLSVNKKFSGKTVIKTDKGSVGNWFRDKFSNMENINLEDPKFENLFEVYSTDQIEARYLLTPSFMERLMEVKKVFSSGDIQCSFYDNSLLMTIPIDKNMFEPGPITEPEDFIDDSKSLLKEMQLIFDISDTLELNIKTGL
jgi:hypothetical protein